MGKSGALYCAFRMNGKGPISSFMIAPSPNSPVTAIPLPLPPRKFRPSHRRWDLLVCRIASIPFIAVAIAAPFCLIFLVSRSSVLNWTFCITFFELFVALGFKSYWIDPLRVRRLYRGGATTSGVIAQKSTKSCKGNVWHYLEFVYEVPGTGAKTRVKTLVWAETDWHRAFEGEEVTVLYNPRRPTSAVTYEYGGYKIDASTLTRPDERAG